jgi:hypothetical protein
MVNENINQRQFGIFKRLFNTRDTQEQEQEQEQDQEQDQEQRGVRTIRGRLPIIGGIIVGVIPVIAAGFIDGKLSKSDLISAGVFGSFGGLLGARDPSALVVMAKIGVISIPYSVGLAVGNADN